MPDEDLPVRRTDRHIYTFVRGPVLGTLDGPIAPMNVTRTRGAHG
jgi:hypothetical protein